MTNAAGDSPAAPACPSRRLPEQVRAGEVDPLIAPAVEYRSDK
jgi:hypothetical protein